MPLGCKGHQLLQLCGRISVLLSGCRTESHWDSKVSSERAAGRLVKLPVAHTSITIRFVTAGVVQFFSLRFLDVVKPDSAKAVT